jgi:hypothetical protein
VVAEGESYAPLWLKVHIKLVISFTTSKLEQKELHPSNALWIHLSHMDKDWKDYEEKTYDQ